MAITLYLCLLLISGARAFLFAAVPPESVYLSVTTPSEPTSLFADIPPESTFLFADIPPVSVAGAVELGPRHWCDPSYESNGALRALLDPLHTESAREYCRTYISALPDVTVTAVAAEVMPLLFPLQTTKNVRYYICEHRTNP